MSWGMGFVKRLMFIPMMVILAFVYLPVFLFKGIDKANDYMDKAFSLIEEWQN